MNVASILASDIVTLNGAVSQDLVRRAKVDELAAARGELAVATSSRVVGERDQGRAGGVRALAFLYRKLELTTTPRENAGCLSTDTGYTLTALCNPPTATRSLWF